MRKIKISKVIIISLTTLLIANLAYQVASNHNLYVNQKEITDKVSKSNDKLRSEKLELQNKITELEQQIVVLEEESK